MAIAAENLGESLSFKITSQAQSVFSRLEMKVISVRVVDHVTNQLPRSSELHWAKAEGGIGVKRLLEYTPTQPPFITVLRQTKATVVSIAGIIPFADWFVLRILK